MALNFESEGYLCGATEGSTHPLRLVLMVGSLYLILNHVMSLFFFSLDHQYSSSNLQHLVHTYISISYVSLLYLNQHHHFRIYFVDNKFEKNNYIKI
jgi:hypothetical protein